MNIKKVDDKSMVIHTKEKAKLHVKREPEAKIKGRNILVVEKGPKIAGADKGIKADSKNAAMKAKSNAKKEVRKAVQKENAMYAGRQKSKQDSKKDVSKKNGTTKGAASVGAMAALDQMDGGNEVYESYMVARTISAPAESAADAGRRLYRSQAARSMEQSER